MKKIVFLCLILLVAGCNTSENQTNEPLIGGERDEHGCLGPAGYSYNEDIKACAREWELEDSDDIKAVKIAIEHLGRQNGLTIVEVKRQSCLGCFEIKYDIYGKQDMIKLNYWKISNIVGKNYCSEGDKEMDVCVNVYEPVCAYDSAENVVKTFGNGCFACMHESVKFYVDGECKKEVE